MPVSDRSGPLDPDERRAILAALTTGGRSQRSVAEDPTIRGTLDQIRTVVRDAIRDDPSLLDQFPNLTRRRSPVIRNMELVDADGESAEQTAAASVVAAGVPLTAVRLGRVVTTVRSRIHFVRNPDGSFAAVRAQQAETRVEWLPVGAVPLMPPATHHVRAHDQPRHRWSAAVGAPVRMSLAFAVGLVALLLIGGAALFRMADGTSAQPAVSVAAVDSASRPTPR